MLTYSMASRHPRQRQTINEIFMRRDQIILGLRTRDFVFVFFAGTTPHLHMKVSKHPMIRN